jgi:hypothetical protein
MEREPRNLSNQQREWLRVVPGTHLDDDLHDEGAFGLDLGDLQDENPTQSAPIKQDHYFSELNRYSNKYLKFQQRKSTIEGLSSDHQCLALSLMWIGEKCSTTNSSVRPGQKATLFVAQSDDASTHAYNAEAMKAADLYKNMIKTGSDISPISEALGLKPHHVSFEIVKQKDSSNYSVIDFSETLTAVALKLEKGKAILIEVLVRRPYVDTAGHAISLYRSRGGKLHFFDSNVGAYEVNDVGDFMKAWIEGCKNRGWTVSPYFRGFGEDDSWYHAYER